MTGKTGKVIHLFSSNPLADEPYVGEEKLLQPPPPKSHPTTEPIEEPNCYGPKATTTTPRKYTTIFYGTPILDELSHSEKLVYGYIRSWNDSGKPCNVTISTICTATCLSDSQVRRIIKRLSKRKLLKKSPTPAHRPLLLEARRDV